MSAASGWNIVKGHETVKCKSTGVHLFQDKKSLYGTDWTRQTKETKKQKQKSTNGKGIHRLTVSPIEVPPDKVIQLFLVNGVKVLELMESTELDYIQTIWCDHICKISMKRIQYDTDRTWIQYDKRAMLNWPLPIHTQLHRFIRLVWKDYVPLV